MPCPKREGFIRKHADGIYEHIFEFEECDKVLIELYNTKSYVTRFDVWEFSGVECDFYFKDSRAYNHLSLSEYLYEHPNVKVASWAKLHATNPRYLVVADERKELLGE